MTSNALATNGTRALEVPDDYVPVAGYENMDPDDFSLPTLKLVQAQTTIDGAEAHMGEYVKTDTADFFAEPRALIVGIQKSRIMFPKEYGGSASDPLCRSDNALHPRPEFIDKFVEDVRIAEDCADCPLGKWGADGEAPRCTLSENWAAILDSQDIVILRLKGTSAAASKMLKNIMRANKIKSRPTYIQLGSQLKKSDKGKYHVATLAALAETPPAESLELARQFVGLNLASRAADEVTESSAPASYQGLEPGYTDPPHAAANAELYDDPNEQDERPF